MFHLCALDVARSPTLQHTETMGTRRVIDDLGRTVELPARPRRVVSLVPSLTETLFVVGAALIGVTRYCTEPAVEVASVAKVGGTKNPDLAAIRALAPDLVVMNAEENRREDFAALESSGLPVFVTEPKTVADGVRVVARVADAAGCAERGHALADDMATRLARITAHVGTATPVRYFCPIWRKPWMAFNADTYAHDLLRTAGGENVCADALERYPIVELQAIARTTPEVLLLPDEPYRFSERDRPALAPLAVAPARVHFVDGKALSWYGPRIADGVEHFATLFARAHAKRS